MVIGGAPGVGKSTLGRRLGRELEFPFLSKDGFKEALYDAVRPSDRAAAKTLGSPAYHVMYHALSCLLDSGIGAVLESNFVRGLSEPELRPFLTRTRAVLLLCSTSPAIAGQRYAERALRGERHWGHHDDPDVGTGIAAMPDLGVYDVELDVPTLRVDTTDGYAPTLAEVLGFVRRTT